MGLSKEKITRWSQSLSKFAGLEGVSQAAQLLTSIIVVRNLPKQDYAWYSMVIGLQTSMALFSASGMNPGMMALGGPVAKDRFRLGSVVSSSLRLRRILAIAAILIGTPVYSILLWRSQCSPLIIAGVMALSIMMLNQQIKIQTLSFPLLVNSEYQKNQIFQAGLNISRFVLVSLAVVMKLTGVIFLLGASVAATTVAISLYLKKKAVLYSDPEAPAEPGLQNAFMKYTTNGLFPSLFSIFQAQISTILISIFGGFSNVADLGALTRFGLILTLPTSILNNIFLPRMAASASAQEAKKTWLRALFVAGIFSAGSIVAGLTLGSLFTKILGAQYRTVEQYMPLYSIYLASTLMISAFASLAQSRGWVKYSWMRPIIVILFQALSLAVLPPTTIMGAISLSIAGGIGFFIFEIFILIRGIRGQGNLT